MKLPPQIENFVKHNIRCQIDLLPQHYPDIGNWEAFQTGYKTQKANGHQTPQAATGGFRENWYVIATNDYDDPFFIDLQEAEKGFPVYFAFHGAGRWTPVVMAESIKAFEALLQAIKALEPIQEQLLSYIEGHFTKENIFWKEVWLAIKEAPEIADIPLQSEDLADFILGKVFITDLGSQKIQLLKFLRASLHLSPQEALLLSQQQEIEFKEGYLRHLRRDMDKLHQLGATTDFRPVQEDL